MNPLHQKLIALEQKYRELAWNYVADRTDDEPEYDNGREVGFQSASEQIADDIKKILAE
jgi:hypothetical protein